MTLTMTRMTRAGFLHNGAKGQRAASPDPDTAVGTKKLGTRTRSLSTSA